MMKPKRPPPILTYLQHDYTVDCPKWLTWRQWVKLGKQCPAKKCLAVAAPVVAAASMVDAHPELHDDIRTLRKRSSGWRPGRCVITRT